MLSNDRGFYVGEYFHNLDAKGRLTIPSKWRFRGDEADVYLGLPNPQGCITVYPPRMIAKLEEQVSQISLGDLEGQAVLMDLSSMAQSFGCDKSGRIMLNERLIRHAGIEKEAVLLGTFSTFTIWSAERYADRGAGKTFPVPEEVRRMTETLKKFGL